jgi:hypothetical protein
MFEQYENQIKREVEAFKKDVKKMQESENPYFKINDVLNYEIKQRRKQLDERVAEIKAQFEAEVDARIEEAREKAVRSVPAVSDTEKRIVDDMISELTAEVMMSTYDKQKHDAVDKFIEKIKYLKFGGLFELKRQFPQLVEKFNDDEIMKKQLHVIFNEFKSLKTPEQEELEALEQAKESGVDYHYRIYRMISRHYSDYKYNRHY